jgi:uncharacterized protein
MYLAIEEPTETISNDAVKVWRISNTIGHGIAILILTILVVCDENFGWYDWIGLVLYFLLGFTFFSSIYSIFIEPIYLQKTWRYSIDHQFVQMKRGKWSEQHTLIPMEKVEYVRTEQGPIMRRYGLYNIEIGTTASNHIIPAIPRDEAKRLKAQVAVFAKIQDQEAAKGEK